MKMLKKLFAFVAAFAMLLALPTTVLAEGDESAATSTPEVKTTGNLTIKKATGTYAIYQVFTGDLVVDGDSKTLSNVVWGESVTPFEYDIGTNEKSKVAKVIAEFLSGKGEEEVKKFAKTAISYKTKKYQSVTATNGEAKFENLPVGYYVVENTEVGTEEAYTSYILQVVGDTEVNNKSGVPELEKKVQDKNDSTGETTTWQDSADYDIGDAVPFKLTGTIADNYSEYTTYYYAFHDVEEAGLTFSKITSVYVLNGKEKIGLTENDYEVHKKTADASVTDDCTFEVVFNNLKDIKVNGAEVVTKDSKIVVEYESTLNSESVLGNTGNVNKAKLEFSNNPYNTQGGNKGETPWDNVIVFTYKTVINKVDQDGTTPLKGAGFTLYKFDYSKNSYQPYQNGTPELNEEGTSFTFKGLDDGKYKLVETTVPTGYNKADDILFTVTANHHDKWASDDRTSVLTNLESNGLAADKITGDVATGTITSSVINKKGTVLPSTGGIGTTVFYVTGAILMLGAGVLLVSRKRVSK